MESFQTVGKILHNDYTSNGMPETPVHVTDVKKVLAVTRQCLDRLENILCISLNSFYAKQEKVNDTYPCLPRTEPPPIDIERIERSSLPPVCFSPPKVSERSMLKVGTTSFLQMEGSRNPQGHHVAETALMPNPMCPSALSEPIDENKTAPPASSPHQAEMEFGLPPLAQVQKDNSALCRQYQMLIQRAKDPSVKANMRLQLQRRLAENLALGRAKQKQYLQQLKEQERKAADMAARKLQESKLCETEEDQGKQELYASILHYENVKAWPKVLLKLLMDHPTNPIVVKHVVMRVLGNDEHPLSQWLSQRRAQLQNEMSQVIIESCRLKFSRNNSFGESEAKCSCPTDTESRILVSDGDPTKEVVGNITGEALCLKVVSVVRTTMLMLGLSFEPLRKEEAWDACYSAVEDHLTGPLWPSLISVLRMENLEAEQRVEEAMAQLSGTSPQEMKVPEYLWDSCRDILNETVDALRAVPAMAPSNKVKVLVRVTKLVCSEPNDSEEPQCRAVGADDLVPALSYMLVQCGIPQLYSECLALEQVLDSRYLLGEGGYCLTSVLMALKYLESLA